MKQLLGLITATAIFVPTAVSAETIQMIVDFDHNHAIGSIVRTEIRCFKMFSSDYGSADAALGYPFLCTEVRSTIYNRRQLTAEEVLELSEFYRQNGGQVQLFGVPSGETY